MFSLQPLHFSFKMDFYNGDCAMYGKGTEMTGIYLKIEITGK